MYKYIVVIDKVYRFHMQFDLFDEIYIRGASPVSAIIQNMSNLNFYGLNYLIISLDTDKIIFNFDSNKIITNYRGTYHVCITDYSEKSINEINVVSDSLKMFIIEHLNDKSNESMQILYDKLSGFAEKYVHLYGELCNLTVTSSVKSARIN